MAFSKLDLAIVAVIAVALLWIEHDHRIVIGTPMSAEIAARTASVCPDSDSVPFSADCIAFIEDGTFPALQSRASPAASASALAPNDAGEDFTKAAVSEE
jgi:hypothetical protein